jgi:DeoR/GlpR family transcriptional regulator of sugar metabolism
MKEIIAYVKKQATAQINEIESHLSDSSRNTIKKDLAYLVNEGLLLKSGAGRGVRYYVEKK